MSRHISNKLSATYMSHEKFFETVTDCTDIEGVQTL